MKQIKHVLVLLLLVLPMFALAPSLVASPNEALINSTEADSFLPATSVKQTMRVAVYVESNLTLPAYATGGVYTDYSANVISFLQGEGFAVTPISTQDILDHELTVADFDALVLPDQLPKDEIINHVKDYWLGGGGILTFESAVGYLFYAGMIHSDYEGMFMLYPTDGAGLWAYQPYDGIDTTDRHPITKSLEANTEYPFTGNSTYIGGYALGPLLGDSYIELATFVGNPSWSSLFAIDNQNKGGKIVHLPGNCSSFEAWIEPVIVDAIDWLAPRAKGKILVDLSHEAYFRIDSWDEGGAAIYYSWRDIMVNHSFIVDKLHPSSSGNLTAANLAGYDMLFLPFAKLNYTNTEIATVTDWVNSGGGLFCVGDRWFGPSLTAYNQNLNRLLTNFDVSSFETSDNSDPIDFYDTHPTTESCTTFYDNVYGLVNFTGDASGVWRVDDVNYVSAADTHGAGRIILVADLNWIADNHISENSHMQYSINVANWLTTATADTLFYIWNLDIANPYYAPAALALNDLGIPFYLVNDPDYLNLSLYSQQWNLVIIDSAWPGINPYFDDFSTYLDTGGNLIVSWHMMTSYPSEPLYSKVGFAYSANYPDEAPFHIWSPSHGIFNYPNNYGALNFTPGYDIGEEGDLMTVYANATAIAGLTVTNQAGNANIVLGFDGQVLWNAYLIDQLTADLDDSTYADNFELWENEIAFMYFREPMINHPDDVTYMETETGNEISWTPAAPAGPWEYVVRENGSIVESGLWNGASITISVDGVNASITDYELTVFDRLGYSVSDLVILNVTAYVSPTGTGWGLPIDSTTLLIIAAVLIVIIIICVAMRKRK